MYWVVERHNQDGQPPRSVYASADSNEVHEEAQRILSSWVEDFDTAMGVHDNPAGDPWAHDLAEARRSISATAELLEKRQVRLPLIVHSGDDREIRVYTKDKLRDIPGIERLVKEGAYFGPELEDIKLRGHSEVSNLAQTLMAPRGLCAAIA